MLHHDCTIAQIGARQTPEPAFTFRLAQAILILLGAALSAAPSAASGGEAAVPPDLVPGAYRFEDGAFLFIGEGDGHRKLVVLPDEQIRGLAPDPAGWIYGPSLGATDPVEGWLRPSSDQTAQQTIGWWTRERPHERLATRLAVREEPASFRNGRTKLAGTLISPEGRGPFPALVLAHGSGAETRNRGPLVYELARLGFAVLTFDKRGSGESKGDLRSATLDDLAKDVVSGVDWLQQQPRVDPKRIGLWGHSQGAWIVVLAASRSTDVAFVVAECGGGVSPIEQHLSAGSNYYRVKRRLPEEQIEEIEKFRRLKYHVAAGLEPRKAYETELARVKSLPWFAETGGKLPDGFWEINGAYDPVVALARLRQPVLFLLADHDSSTPTEATRRVLETTLAKSGHLDHSIIVIPNASHELFEVSRLAFDDDIPAAVRLAPGYTSALRAWLASHAALGD